MKAIVVENPGGIDSLLYREDALKPEAKEGYVVIKNHYAGVNFIDIYHRNGLYELPKPFIVGRESAGQIVEVGKGVSGLKEGDRVVYVGESTYAEYSLANASSVQKLPDGITYKAATAIGLQGLTALTMVRDGYVVKEGDWVLVHAAAGGVGQLLCAMSAHFGAKVIGTVGSKEKVETAKNSGAHYVVNTQEDDVKEKVLELTNGLGCHAVFDGVGKATFDISLECARRLGTVISFGNASGTVAPIPITVLTKKNLKLMRPQLFAYLATPEESNKWWNELFDLLLKGVVKEPNPTVYSLKDAGKAQDDLENRRTTGKLVLKVCDCN